MYFYAFTFTSFLSSAGVQLSVLYIISVLWGCLTNNKENDGASLRKKNFYHNFLSILLFNPENEYIDS